VGKMKMNEALNIFLREVYPKEFEKKNEI